MVRPHSRCQLRPTFELSGLIQGLTSFTSCGIRACIAGSHGIAQASVTFTDSPLSVASLSASDYVAIGRGAIPDPTHHHAPALRTPLRSVPRTPPSTDGGVPAFQARGICEALLAV